MTAIAETNAYVRKAKKLLDEGDRRAIRDILKIDPFHGAVMPGSGGVRKMRYALPGRGKSGGARVIHYYKTIADTVFLLDVYAKNQKEDLTKGEINDLKKLVGLL